jgi:hypothetical protein
MSLATAIDLVGIPSTSEVSTLPFWFVIREDYAKIMKALSEVKWTTWSGTKWSQFDPRLLQGLPMSSDLLAKKKNKPHPDSWNVRSKLSNRTGWKWLKDLALILHNLEHKGFVYRKWNFMNVVWVHVVLLPDEIRYTVTSNADRPRIVPQARMRVLERPKYINHWSMSWPYRYAWELPYILVKDHLPYMMNRLLMSKRGELRRRKL